MSKPLFPSAVNFAKPEPVLEEPLGKDTAAGASQNWLSNTSFQPHLLVQVEDSLPKSPKHSETEEVVRKRSPITQKGLESVPKKKPKKQGNHSKETAESRSSAATSSGKYCWLEETGLKPEAAYCFDRKPDFANLTYGTLYRSSIATYKRSSTVCLGQSAKLKFIWDDGRNHKSLKQPKHSAKSANRYFTTRLIPSEQFLSLAQAAASKTPATFVGQDFIKVSEEEISSKDVKEENSSSLKETVVGRKTSEYQKALSENPNDVGLWLEFIEFQDKYPLWGFDSGSDLSNFTDGKEHSTSGDRKHQRMAIINRKIAIFEKALEKNPIDTKLLTEHMKLCEEVWEHKRIVKHWKDLVFRQPHNTELWLGYLSYCQNHYSSFSTSSLLSLYSKVLTTLVSIVEGKLVSHKPAENIEEAMLCVFLNLCYFLRYAGHTEKAIALFQALIEFTFHCPDVLHTVSFDEKVKYFEPFWDSSVPRFGEMGVKSWKVWFKSQQGDSDTVNNDVEQECGFLGTSVPTYEERKQIPLEEETEHEILLVKGKPLHQAWGDLENFREQEHFLPWCPAEFGEDEPEDVDRIVLFDDVSSFLFSISKESSLVALLEMFLNFIGGSVNSPKVAIHALQWVPVHLLGSGQIFSCVSQLFDLLSFDTRNSIRDFHYTGPTIGEGLGPLSTAHGASCLSSRSFIASCFNQALLLVPQVYAPHFACCWLFFECGDLLSDLHSGEEQVKPSKQLKQKAKSFDKFAKALLRHPSCRNDVTLWSLYAVLKGACGDRKASLSIMETVCVQASLTTAQPSDLHTAVTTYVSLLLGSAVGPVVDSSSRLTSFATERTGSDELLTAKHALICLGEGKFVPLSASRVTGTAVLKCERRLRERLEETLFSQDEPNLVDSNFISLGIIARAQHLYINSSLNSFVKFLGEVETTLCKFQANQRLSGNVATLLARTISTEVQLLYHHSLHHPDPPSLMRSVLLRAITYFPENAHFLALFTSFEHHFMMVGKVRSYFKTHLLNSKTPIPWLVAIAFEESRRRLLERNRGKKNNETAFQLEELESGVSHRIRSLYVRATRHGTGKNCPLLWRKYLAFELDQRGPKAAEAVLYQAVQQCPWAKVLYMDGARLLSVELGSKVLDMIEEKEIRLRAPVEEVKLLQEADLTNLAQRSLQENTAEMKDVLKDYTIESDV